MSIAEEEKQINEIITTSKLRLRQVDDKLEMLANEKSSIDEDIAILSQRVDVRWPNLDDTGEAGAQEECTANNYIADCGVRGRLPQNQGVHSDAAGFVEAGVQEGGGHYSD